MCKGLGLDLCEIARMEPLEQDGRFLARYFTEAEVAYIRSREAGAAQTLAGMFAAKEAVLKALGTGLSLPMQEIEITHTETRQPQITLHGRAAQTLADRGGGQLMVSITHEAGMAAAVVVWL